MSTCLQILYKHAIDIVKKMNSTKSTAVLTGHLKKLSYLDNTINIPYKSQGFCGLRTYILIRKKNTIENIKCVC